MQLHIVINTEDKGALQKVAGLLSEYEIDSLTWEAPPKKGPVYRTPDTKGVSGSFVEAARGTLINAPKDSAIDLD